MQNNFIYMNTENNVTQITSFEQYLEAINLPASIIFFTASFCGICTQMKPIFKNFANDTQFHFTKFFECSLDRTQWVTDETSEQPVLKNKDFVVNIINLLKEKGIATWDKIGDSNSIESNPGFPLFVCFSRNNVTACIRGNNKNALLQELLKLTNIDSRYPYTPTAKTEQQNDSFLTVVKWDKKQGENGDILFTHPLANGLVIDGGVSHLGIRTDCILFSKEEVDFMQKEIEPSRLITSIHEYDSDFAKSIKQKLYDCFLDSPIVFSAPKKELVLRQKSVVVIDLVTMELTTYYSPNKIINIELPNKSLIKVA